MPETDHPNLPPVSFPEAARFWAKLGFVSFGGPAGQIALMHRELVERRRWISEERFLHALNFCVLLPGPEAQQLAIYVGWLLHGTRGGVFAGTLFVLPSALILLFLSYVYAAHGDLAFVVGALAGWKPVVVAIILDAVWRIGRRALRTGAHLLTAIASFVAIYFFDVPFPLILLAAATIGVIFIDDAGAAPHAPAAKPTAESATELTANLGEPHEPNSLSSSSFAHTFRVVLAGFALWLVPGALLAWSQGLDSIHVAQYGFFTQTALVTFGGAYAVLAYVTQRTVEDFSWLTRAQAVDGLALAETTPGPLIMVLQFVGFVAAWNAPGALPRTASAILAAAVTTYVTFLPCFVFVLVGAPYMERLRRVRHLNRALAGITAGVVGVILNLGVVFGTAVFLPRGVAGGVDPFAVVLASVALLLLRKFGVGAAWVVLAGGAAGLLRVLIAG